MEEVSLGEDGAEDEGDEGLAEVVEGGADTEVLAVDGTGKAE